MKAIYFMYFNAFCGNKAKGKEEVIR